MLLTTCPTCAAQFKVQPEHLNVRQGRVMCGRCRGVFNAFESLRRVEDPPVSAFLRGEEFYPDVSLPMSVMGELPPAPPALVPPNVPPHVPPPAPSRPPPPAPVAVPIAVPVTPLVAPTAAVEPEMGSAPMVSKVSKDFEADIDPELARLLAEYDEKHHKSATDLYRSQRLRAAIDELEAETRDLHVETVKLAAIAQPAIAQPAIAPPEVAHAEPPQAPAPIAAPNPVSTFGELPPAPIVNEDVRDPKVNLAALGLAPAPAAVPVPVPISKSANASAKAHAALVEEVGDVVDADPASDPLRDYAGDPANPLLKRPLAPPNPPRSRWWGAGVALLAVVLVLQLIFVFRDTLAANYAQLRAPLMALSERFGFKLAFSRDASLIKIDNSDLTEQPGKPGRYLLVATLVNQGRVKQDLPTLEVRLTDSGNQTVISRNFAPNEYLGRTTKTDDGIAPSGDLAINLSLDVAGKTSASGYALRVFYP
jgi:predicted Zn finger-like uncharacterized protein